MAECLVIADDFTGALDCGVLFAERGYITKVYTEYPVSIEVMQADVQVLVVTAESRHLKKEAAFERVYQTAVEGKKAGIRYFYKKTDSALRGNIGSELTAFAMALGIRELLFQPAYLAMGRTTEEGIQYIQGIPVSQSPFGKDPFEPVCCSEIADVINGQADLNCISYKTWKENRGNIGNTLGQICIVLPDTLVEQDYDNPVREINKQKWIKAAAGSGGLVPAFSSLFGYTGAMKKDVISGRRLLIVSGSLHPMAVSQSKKLEAEGVPVSYLTNASDSHIVKNIHQAWKKDRIAVLTADPQAAVSCFEGKAGLECRRAKTAERFGRLAAEILKGADRYILLVIGGDTLYEILRHLNIRDLQPLYQIEPGIVVSAANDRKGKIVSIISKAGGFGDLETLTRVCKKVHMEENI